MFGVLSGGFMRGIDQEIAELDEMKKLLQDAEKELYGKVNPWAAWVQPPVCTRCCVEARSQSIDARN
eukprot:6207867-Pleurochrysis_carterae.AAC.3